MELVYLWVEEYKNIHHQGFNFSPRFEFDYNDDTKKLTKVRDDSKTYKSIFPDNINITAIVGENGSGKSGIIELIMLCCSGSKNNKNENNSFIIAYDNEEKRFLSSSLSSEKVTFPDISSIPMNTNLIYNLHYNPTSEFMSTSFFKYIGDILGSVAMYRYDYKPKNMNILTFPSTKNKIIDIRKNENESISKMFQAKEIYGKDLDEKVFSTFESTDKISFIPEETKFSLYEDILTSQLPTSRVRELLLLNMKDLSLESLSIYFALSIYSAVELDEDSYIWKSDYFITKGLNDYFKKYIKKEKNKTHNEADMKELISNIENIRDINLVECITEELKKLSHDISLTAQLIEEIKKRDGYNPLLHTLVKNDKILSFLPSYIKIETINKDNVNFNDYSYGEKTLINLVYSFLLYISISKQHKYDVYNILLDEVETGLNPKWQKKMLNIVIKLFSSFEDIKFNFIISSHSPFILSDLPRENVIFLKDGKQIDALDKKQTFGANIHTLLSDSFFMDGGLMGEFAKGKIDEVIELLNSNGKLEDEDLKLCKNIVSIIGEPILKKQLQRMLNNKLELSNKDEIDIIKEQMIKLTNRLSEIENDTDKKI